MPALRISMRHIKEVLRLRFHAGLSIRQIRASTRLSVGAIQKLLKEAERLELGIWPLPPGLDDAELERRLYPSSTPAISRRFAQPNWPVAHQELTKKGMTKQLLWEEYCQANSDRAYSYSQYCERYRQWVKKQRRSMRQTHRAGEKAFIDYAGSTIPVVDNRSGEILFNAAIFVAVMGASNYTYAEATRSQKLPDWLQSHVRLFDFLGGVPEAVVPDNLRSAINKACRYDPETNPSYQQLAEHYAVAVLPARPYKAKDKAKAENGVLVVLRWIIMRLRHHTFFSLGELNQCIGELLVDLNARAFKQLPGNRKEAFGRLDKPVLRALPRQPYQYVDIKKVRVNIDYHVQYNDHHYSVPHQYVGEKLEVHAAEATLQVYFREKLVATHVKNSGYGQTTEAAHMPERHAKHLQWTPERLLSWAANIGPDTRQWIDTQLHIKDHPEQAYRICLGLLSLSKDYPACRLNNACRLANAEGLMRLKQIKSVLQSNRDQLQAKLDLDSNLPQSHKNVRGASSFNQPN